MASQVAGIITFMIDGVFYPTAGDCTFSSNSTTREGMIDTSPSLSSFKQSPVWGYVQSTFRTAPYASVQLFEAMTNVTVTVVLATGEVVTASGCFTEGVQVANPIEGTFEAKFLSSNVLVA